MQRRKFSREFKIEAARCVGSVSRRRPGQENVLRKWVKELGSDPASLRTSAHGVYDSDANLVRQQLGRGTTSRVPMVWQLGDVASFSRRLISHLCGRRRRS